MDDWTIPYPNTDLDSPSSQPMLLDQPWGGVEDRFRAAHADAAARADADRRAAELEQSRVWDSLDDGRTDLDVQLALAAPPGAALTL